MTVIRVQGMTCDHCVGSVHAELSRIPGVREVRVDPVLLAAAIDEAGYDIVDDA